MSSAEEGNNEDGRNVQDTAKKRRIQRACDICRRKKIRCDGAQMPNNRCSNCITYSYECTYVQTAKKRGPPKGYVENLENRVQQMEALLKKTRPDIDLNLELGGPPDRATWISDRRQIVPSSVCKDDTRSKNAFRCLASPDSNGQSSFTFVDGDELSSSDDELAHSTLTEGLKRLALQPMDRRFLGKSSGIVLIQAAINLKRTFVGDKLLPTDMLVPPNRRTEFWVPNHWETVGRREVAVLHYPPNDLLNQLLDNYFTYANPYHPILHRPSFERAIADGRHINDNDFGTVVLMVCALGARWSDDPRVLAEASSKFSRGWKYFEQCHDAHNSILLPPRLYDLQVYALCSLFLLGSSSPQAAWTISGVGIRLAQDVGAHRRKVYKTQTTVESELWKRAFWCLVSIDRVCSLSLGRPCAIQDEDFDLDMPLEVDDAYWENADRSKAFKQPLTIAPTTAYFNCQLKLNQILAFALRTIYSINKSKILLGFVGSQWEQHIVSELDSALNKWIDTVPDHLRWDPHRENFLHFSQSAMLYISYYHLQIIIHRPFIPSPRKPSPLSFPSLAICTNAARACSHIADFMRKRQATTHPFIQIAVFTAGIVLLLNMWGAKKSGVNIEPESQMADVYKCMRVLRQLENRWPSAGRLWDILNELAFVGDIPLQAYSPAPTNKRDRNGDSPRSATSNASAGPSKPPPSSQQSEARNDHGSASSGSSPSDAPIPSPPTVLNDVNPSIHENPLMGDIPTQWFSDAQPMFAPQYEQPSGIHFDLFQNAEQVHGGIPVDPMSSSRVEQSMTTPVVSDSNGMSSNLAFDMSQFFGVPEGYTYQTSSDANALLTNPEALQMWSAVPTSFDLAEWGNYLDTVTGTNVVNPEVDLPFPSNGPGV